MVEQVQIWLHLCQVQKRSLILRLDLDTTRRRNVKKKKMRTDLNEPCLFLQFGSDLTILFFLYGSVQFGAVILSDF